MGMIAIIPARGGSKRIPRKNIREFMGRPIISYSIAAALGSSLFDTVMVSTDDMEIAEVARQHGAEVPFLRSKKASDDFATTADVVREVLGEYKRLNHEFSTVCCIYPCAPFVTPALLHKARKLLDRHDAVMPVTSYPSPVEWAVRVKNGKILPVDVVSKNKRSQDIEPAYHDTGMFYLFKSEAMSPLQSLLPENTAALLLGGHECQDIDTLADWKLAEMKYQALHGETESVV